MVQPKIEVICPIYQAKDRLHCLIEGILKQEKIEIIKVTFLITNTGDGVENLIPHTPLFSYDMVEKENFNHALTREKAMMESDADIVVLLSDDIKFINTTAIYELIQPIVSQSAAISFGRQICTNKSIERYTRRKNYPDKSYFVSKEDIEQLQIQAFFFSDSFSAYDLKIFKEIGGYDHRELPTNEDMYYARKVLLAGYRKAYVAEAQVEHSHYFTLKEVYHRYYLFGQFFKEADEFLQYKSTDSGLKLALYIFKSALKECNIKVLIRFFPDMVTRWIAKKRGQRK